MARDIFLMRQECAHQSPLFLATQARVIFFAPVDAGQFHVQFLVFLVITKQLMVAAILEYVELRK